MEAMLRTLTGLTASVLFLASCAIQSETTVSPTIPSEAMQASDEPLIQVAQEQLNDYDCDTSGQQPLETLDDREWKSYSVTCQSDKTTPSQTLPAMALSSDVLPCQLEDRSEPRLKALEQGLPDQDYIVGFPRTTSPYRLPDEAHRVLFIPVDFIDYKDDVDPLSFAVPAAEMMDAYYETYTRGAVSFDWYFHDEWITIEQPISNFTQTDADANLSQWGDKNKSVVDRFWQAAIAAADPVVDFTGADLVFFVMPRDQDTSQEFNLWPPFSETYETNEGTIMRGFVPGSYQFREDKDLWAFWTHETLHYFRLPDLYWHDQNSIKRSEYTLPGALQGYDIMTNQDGVSKALTTWLMWLSGWLDDSEVACITGSDFAPGSIEISPVHFDDGLTKSIILTVSDTQAIVVESRRSTQFDVVKAKNRSREGVIVYALDTTIGNGNGVATLLAPSGRGLVRVETKVENGVNLDAVLYEGNSISVGGYVIEVAQSNMDSDVVSISRDDSWLSGDEPTYVCYTKENRDLSVEYPLSCPIVY